MGRKVGLVIAALFAAACGGATEPPAPDACDGLAGDYDVALAPVGTVQPSQAFSLSLSATGTACSALIAPSGYPAVTLPARLDAGALRLDDTSGPELPTLTAGWYWGLHFYREYHFKELSLARAATGALSGAASALVDVQWAEDDICSVDVDQSWSGTLGPDVTPPGLRAGGRSVIAPKRPSSDCFSPTGGKARPGLPAAILPWETLAVEATEPVPGLSAGLSLELGGVALATSWTDAPFAPDVWAWTALDDWDAVRGKTLTVRAAASLRDRAGHALVERALPVSVLDVGPALASHDFDKLGNVAVFGDATLEGGVLRVEAPCNSGTGGVAGRLRSRGADAVRMRLRADGGTSVLIDVAGKSGRHYTGQSPFGGEWATVDVPIDSESEVGFSVVPNSLCHWTTSAVVWVDRVWVE